MNINNLLLLFGLTILLFKFIFFQVLFNDIDHILSQSSILSMRHLIFGRFHEMRDEVDLIIARTFYRLYKLLFCLLISVDILTDGLPINAGFSGDGSL